MKQGLLICLLSISVSVCAQYGDSLPDLIMNHYKNVNFLEQDESSIWTCNADTLNRILDIYWTQYTAQSPQYAACMLWCAYICERQGDNVQSRNLLDKSNALFKQYGNGVFAGKDTICEIFSLDVESGLGYNSQRDYIALLRAKKSCRLKKEYFGENSEVYLNALLEVSRLYAERLHYKKANYYHNLGYNAYVKRIKDEFCSTTENGRTIYWEKAKTYINKTISIAHKMSSRSHYGKDKSLASAAYNAMLLSKGLLLNTTISFENYINECGNEEAQELLQQKKNLSQSFVTQQVMDSLDYEILSALQRKGQAFELPHLSIKWEDVASRLSPNDVAIEFYRTEHNEYGAILLKKGWKSPKVIKLKKFAPQSQDSWKLSRLIWTDEIVKYFPVKGDGRILFAADGELQIMSIECLPYVKPESEEDFYTLSDLFPMHRYSSTREVVMRTDSAHYATATLYGGVLYNVDADNLATESEKYPELRNRSLDADTTNRGTIKYLKGTKKEVEAIMALLEENQMDVRFYTSAKANEESFKALSGKHRNILHIATHGFYWSDSTAQKKDYFTQRILRSDSRQPVMPAIDPLNRCGLLFAGAQIAWSGHSADLPEGVQDGILTAKEISLLDLRDADLVVLSACETGVGEINSDGVFGLQRAFKQAGARTIIMSLWPVNDYATQLLMTEFYRNWLTLKQSKREAFRNAQNTVRAEYEEPVYWAGFIMLD